MVFLNAAAKPFTQHLLSSIEGAAAKAFAVGTTASALAPGASTRFFDAVQNQVFGGKVPILKTAGSIADTGGSWLRGGLNAFSDSVRPGLSADKTAVLDGVQALAQSASRTHESMGAMLRTIIDDPSLSHVRQVGRDWLNSESLRGENLLKLINDGTLRPLPTPVVDTITNAAPTINRLDEWVGGIKEYFSNGGLPNLQHSAAEVFNTVAQIPGVHNFADGVNHLAGTVTLG